MSASGAASLYTSAYPLAGQVALLCEGDVAGYETRLLKEWCDVQAGNDPLIDVWPCGTGSAIYGMSDAIGRCRPIVVIEDRDFRSVAEAQKECEKHAADRADRGVSILGWKMWRRNEIENYLLEPEVLLPTMAGIFKCQERDVQEGAAQVLAADAVFQAAQFALYTTRHSWGKSDPSSPLRSGLNIQPKWSDASKRVASPDVSQIVTALRKNVARWQQSFAKPPEASQSPQSPQGVDTVQAFEQKYEEWKAVTWDDQRWLNDWSGKDVLQWLRILLTSRFGWAGGSAENRTQLLWDGLNRTRRDEQDRPIERGIKPILERQFLAHLRSLKSGELFDEWSQIVKMLREHRYAR